jgi:hypothetical protein
MKTCKCMGSTADVDANQRRGKASNKNAEQGVSARERTECNSSAELRELYIAMWSIAEQLQGEEVAWVCASWIGKGEKEARRCR